MNKSVQHKGDGAIRQRSEDSLTIIVYAGRDPKTGKVRQRWETIKRGLNDAGNRETDAQLRTRAERRLRELAAAKDEGQRVIPQRETLGQYLTEWLDAYEADHQGSRTPATYRYLMAHHVIPRIGNIPLRRLRVEDVESVYRAMRDTDAITTKRLTGRTIHHVHAVLSTALRKAVARGRIPRNVAADADKNLRKPEAKQPETISLEQGRRLLARSAPTPIGPLVQLLAFTGLRIGEALGLRWQDVDLDAREIHVRQENERRRRIPLRRAQIAEVGRDRSAGRERRRGADGSSPRATGAFPKTWLATGSRHRVREAGRRADGR
jgi:integrase